MKSKPIYVETTIACSLEDLWEYTQTPEIHQRWDLRFTEIAPLPRAGDSRAQRFSYRTRIGFGIVIEGQGEHTGEKRTGSGTSVSALRFWSDDPRSLISRGSGYWKYVPQAIGIQFLTLYDYETRFGWCGEQIDRLFFRPVISWATAWSFDCLKLWLEEGVMPSESVKRLAMHGLASGILGGIWIYQGLVPKLIARDRRELDILEASGFLTGHETTLLLMIGIVEVSLGVLFLILFRSSTLYKLNIVLLILAAAGALLSEPSLLSAPFGPLPLNVAMIGLAIIGLLSLKDLPRASNCLRKSEAI